MEVLSSACPSCPKVLQAKFPLLTLLYFFRTLNAFWPLQDYEKNGLRNLKTNYRRAFSSNCYRMEISESLFWRMLRSILRASHACACRRTMLPLPLPLVHIFKLTLVYYGSVFTLSGELQGDGHRAERLREPL